MTTIEESPRREVPTLHSVMRLGVTVKPLARPVEHGWRSSPFKAPWSSTLRELGRELVAHGAQITTLEVDLLPIDFRADGGPRGDRRNPRSDGVRLVFRADKIDGAPLLSFDAGEFDHWGDNLRALALGLEALRRADRYGITKRGAQYAGFKALPPGGPSAERGRSLIERHGGVAAALYATHPDTREQRYTDLDFADVQAAREEKRA